MNWNRPKTNLTPLNDGILGGTAVEGDPDSWFPELWTWLAQKYDLSSMLDVGCGCGHTQAFFEDMGVKTFGLDGSEKVLSYHVLPDRCVKHDLTSGPYLAPVKFDLVWCCEVAEHLEEKFAENIIATLADNCGKVLAFCAAPSGAGGYHHVNCQKPEYWAALLESHGLRHRPELTAEAKRLCPAAYGRGPKNYFTRSGMIFERE